MSFRGRLTLFFVLIVLVPMASVALLIFGLISKVETATVNAAVREQGQTVSNLYDQAVADARKAVDPRISDLQLSEAVREGDCRAAHKRLQQLVDDERIARVGLNDLTGDQVCVSGPGDAIAPASIELAGAESVAGLQVSVTRAGDFASYVQEVVGGATGPRLAVCIDNDLRYTSVEVVDDCPLPVRASIEGPQGEDLLVRSFPPDDGFGSERVVVATLTGPDGLAEGARPGPDTDRLLVAGILLGFFILALVFALAISRQLQGQVAGLLEAVRRLGSGDFSTQAPTEGGDEFAELGEEFNKMSHQLASRVKEVRRERERVLAAVRRLGAAMGSSLDRDRLLKNVVTTAVEGVGAHDGRVSIRCTGDPPMKEAKRASGLRGLEAVLHDAERRVLGSGAFAEAVFGATSALAHPLMVHEGDESHMQGVISVARAGDPFSDADRELFRYLAEQAALALENLDLHEAVEHEAVTDELTGLSNRRRFSEVVGLEVKRWRRTGDRVSLIAFDIDDFKAVNDLRSYLQGDEVLRQVARVLRASSRGNDEPARYGGEELAIVLAGASLDEAYVIAERVRTQIEKLEVAALDDRPCPVRVTVSAGVSSLPECARDEHSLVVTAFDALQKAKRGGKNRTVCAPRIT